MSARPHHLGMISRAEISALGMVIFHPFDLFQPRKRRVYLLSIRCQRGFVRRHLGQAKFIERLMVKIQQMKLT